MTTPATKWIRVGTFLIGAVIALSGCATGPYADPRDPPADPVHAGDGDGRRLRERESAETGDAQRADDDVESRARDHLIMSFRTSSALVAFPIFS